MTKLYKDQKNTLYRLAKETGVSYSTLYNYINGRTQIDSMPFWLVVAIANAEKIDAGVLYEKMIDYNTLKFA